MSRTLGLDETGRTRQTAKRVGGLSGRRICPDSSANIQEAFANNELLVKARGGKGFMFFVRFETKLDAPSRTLLGGLNVPPTHIYVTRPRDGVLCHTTP